MIISLLQKVVIELDRYKIPYMLSGSVAMGLYTVPRMTLDIDIVVEINKTNIEEFKSIFSNGYYLDPDTVDEEVKRKGMFNVIDNKSGYKIDFILRKSNEYRLLEFERKTKVKLEGLDIWVVSQEDLIISKIEWIQQLQSQKQIGDIKNLLDNTDIDKTYIKKWCKKLELKTYNLI